MIFLLILLVVGIDGYRRGAPRVFYCWLAGAAAVLLVGPFLISAGGTLENPAGDGILTGMVRRATNDGPGVAIFGLIALVAFYGSAIYLTIRARRLLPKKVASKTTPSNA